MFSKRDTDALMMGLIESALDPMFIINEEGLIHIVNKAAVDQFGWSKEEFIGHNVSMIVAGHHSKKHDQYITQYLRTGKTRVIGKRRELLAKRKDGSQFIIELGLTEVKIKVDTESFFCGFVRDLTQQKEDEALHLHNEKMLNDFVEASFDALFVINQKGTILRVNAASLKEFGWSREEFIGSNISMIMTGNDAKNHHKYIGNYVRTGKKKLIGIQRELVAKRKDGSTFPVWLGLQEVKDPLGEPLFVSFVRNLSDQKKITNLEREKAIAETLLRQSVPDNMVRDDSSHGSESCNDSYFISTVLYGELTGTDSFDKSMEKGAGEALRSLYLEFDRLVDKYHLTRMKTKGDCCMVMTLPVSEFEEVECAHMCHFGLDVLDSLRKHNQEKPWYKLNFRAGIVSGPVVSKNGLWVDAVNLSKMKQTDQVGDIHVPSIVVDMLQDDFNFSPGGTIPKEGKRDLETFFLKGRKKSAPSIIASGGNCPVSFSRGRSNTEPREQSSSRALLQGFRDLMSELEAEEA